VDTRSPIVCDLSDDVIVVVTLVLPLFSKYGHSRSIQINKHFVSIELAPHRLHVNKEYQKDKPDDTKSTWILTTSP